jgi:hypothetical protein
MAPQSLRKHSLPAVFRPRRQDIPVLLWAAHTHLLLFDRVRFPWWWRGRKSLPDDQRRGPQSRRLPDSRGNSL